MSLSNTAYEGISLPAQLARLADLAYNLRWTWDPPTRRLFQLLGQEQWEASGRNPVRLLQTLGSTRLREMSEDRGFLERLDEVVAELDHYMAAESTWFKKVAPEAADRLIAYFSAEFGLTEILPVYSGGLGVLAGDHLKSASDLGVPLVGVGLLYQHGYMRQRLRDDGWQEEYYDTLEFDSLPLIPERAADGSPLLVDVPLGQRNVAARVWRGQVGRTPLYVLDTNIPQNAPEDQDIGDNLYGGDNETRIQQEIVLGIGGYRALTALGIRPSTCHMNEGHPAFLALERVRTLMETQGLSFDAAWDVARAGTVFTTHTPVPAGHDYFSPEQMDRYFSEYYPKLGLSRREFLALGRKHPEDDGDYFGMTVLALRASTYRNGVSELHGEVSREMWHLLWPDRSEGEVPIGHVTNGIHLGTWLSAEMNGLYNRYLGPSWLKKLQREDWHHAEGIPESELWRVHETRRRKLVDFARNRLRAQILRRGGSEGDADAGCEALRPDVLTVGFARRFATYKRATLIFRDPGRLARILNHPERPVQLLFAGKAHPRDEGGKQFIQRIVQMSCDPQFEGRLVFLEDYDMEVARYLVEGADVWLNNPRRPHEASGTSGMKAAANGAVNVSTLDGWWAEAWAGTDLQVDPIGWAIGDGRVYEDADYQEAVEAESLYTLLEHEVVPAFYDRGADGVPARWTARMWASVHVVAPQYNTDRMLREYTERYYLPSGDGFELAQKQQVA
ncbi:MAG: alpha-glucan family phosphorylase [Chloroflexota bacterium]|nr:alpha-glucan family phosphorylase [Chloroflexota bacterium]